MLSLRDPEPNPSKPPTGNAWWRIALVVLLGIVGLLFVVAIVGKLYEVLVPKQKAAQTVTSPTLQAGPATATVPYPRPKWVLTCTTDGTSNIYKVFRNPGADGKDELVFGYYENGSELNVARSFHGDFYDNGTALYVSEASYNLVRAYGGPVEEAYLGRPVTLDRTTLDLLIEYRDSPDTDDRMRGPVGGNYQCTKLPDGDYTADYKTFFSVVQNTQSKQKAQLASEDQAAKEGRKI